MPSRLHAPRLHVLRYQLSPLPPASYHTSSMLPTATLLERHATFDPSGDFEAFVRSAPAKWVVYLLADADQRPVQLLCVKNFRASLRRRLGGDETIGPSKKVNYR